MQSLQNILKPFIKIHGLECGVALTAIRRQWINLVGGTIAAHTFPDSLKGSVLNLIVDTPQWMHHLSFFKEEITAKLKPYAVGDIRFRIGKIPEQKKADLSKDEARLSEDDERFIDNTLKNLRDEELKEKFRTLIVHGLTRRKK
jgi:predicted nucleic acid-binding Zn ribbon protein